jgi:hypothetical protein
MTTSFWLRSRAATAFWGEPSSEMGIRATLPANPFAKPKMPVPSSELLPMGALACHSCHHTSFPRPLIACYHKTDPCLPPLPPSPPPLPPPQG